MAYVFKQNVECLQELDTNITPWLLPKNVQEEGKHILLQEKTENKWKHVAKSIGCFFVVAVV